MRIVVAGVCASGKTTLVTALRSLGLEAYNVAQEHSAVKKLWQHRCPDRLIVLDAALPTIRQRRRIGWGEEQLTLQKQRLTDARQHADLYLPTDGLSRDDVVHNVLKACGLSNTYKYL